MAGRGSAGNVIAGIASFFIPGLGQLVQGRPGGCLGFGALALLGAAVTALLGGLGIPLVLLVALLAALEAAQWSPDEEAQRHAELLRVAEARRAEFAPPAAATPAKRAGRDWLLIITVALAALAALFWQVVIESPGPFRWSNLWP